MSFMCLDGHFNSSSKLLKKKKKKKSRKFSMDLLISQIEGFTSFAFLNITDAYMLYINYPTSPKIVRMRIQSK